MEINIRKWQIKDAKILSKLLNNKKILDNLRDGLPYPYTEKDAKEYILAMINSDENLVFPFAITLNDKVIGSIGVFRKDNIHNLTAELGYYIGEEYWSKGYTTKAIELILEYIFNNTDIIRIFAEPFSYNIASQKALEKAGFQLEGILRKNAIKNGKILDMKMYSYIKK